MYYNIFMESYNKKCNKNFITDINKKYNIMFFSDNDDKKIIILKINDKLIWAKYKILCSYDTQFNFLKLGTDMIVIEKSIIDNKLNKILKDNIKNIKNIDDLEKNIYLNVIDCDYIGIVSNRKKDTLHYYYVIEEILRL